jgi:DNA repair protein RecN (Recombination protein N)
MENYEEYLNNLIKEEKQLKEKLDNLHSKITKEREKAAIVLSKEVTEAMHGLNFNDSVFRIDIQETNISSNGRDKVEFMAILNKGMKEQPLANVASGGELSRVMLALKSVIALKDNIETLIFDEIDAGISGNTAWLVGERLFATSVNRQILCITHLPQIAAFENHHYVIEKENIDEKATTNIYELDNIGSNLELERLSGVSNKNAISDLKTKANNIKNKYKNLV